MDNETRLRKAIEKAIGNGWDIFGDKKDPEFLIWKIDVECGPTYYLETRFGEILEPNKKSFGYYTLLQIIFNPDFLKAFFGEELVWEVYDGNDWHIIKDKDFDIPGKINNQYPAYKYHAHQILDLILEGKNPLEYFDEFLEGE